MKRRYPQRLVIGVTGGIASGKSSVLRELARHGIPTASSDTLAHRCLRPSNALFQRVVRHFGPGILQSGRRINRKALGRIVFSQPQQRKWLERQIHPAVIKGLKTFIKQHRGPIALDIPLLFEARLEQLVNRVLVVSCSQADQLRRLRRRNHLMPQEALRRVRSQWPLAYKRKRADYVINNSGNRKALRLKVARLLAAMQNDQIKKKA